MLAKYMLILGGLALAATLGCAADAGEGMTVSQCPQLATQPAGLCRGPTAMAGDGLAFTVDGEAPAVEYAFCSVTRNDEHTASLWTCGQWTPAGSKDPLYLCAIVRLDADRFASPPAGTSIPIHVTQPAQSHAGQGAPVDDATGLVLGVQTTLGTWAGGSAWSGDQELVGSLEVGPDADHTGLRGHLRLRHAWPEADPGSCVAIDLAFDLELPALPDTLE